MLLGIKSKKELFMRHAIVGSVAVFLVYLVFLSKSHLNFDARLWQALADTSFIFLSVALIIGPLSKLFVFALRFSSWRREIGIWFAVLAFSHSVRVFNYAFNEPGLELPKLLGLMALFWAFILALTSSDKAVNFLGISSWKWLHSFAYVIFYLVVAHSAYFLFWHNLEKNWFAFIFLIMAFLVPLLQISAFIKTVLKQRKLDVDAESKIKNDKIMKVPIIEQKTIAEKTNEVSFDISQQNFSFKAGQYIQIRLSKLNYNDPKGNHREFSIVSSPNDKQKISIAFRNTGSGFKKTLMELPKNTLVEVWGPFGSFTLPKDKNKEIVFLAGGIGITPCLSMIRFATENKLDNKITLLYSNNNEQSAAYLDELKKLSEQNQKLSVINRFGKIDANFIKASIKDLNTPLWYIVGPVAMVAAMKQILTDLGIADENIIFEDFIGY